MHVFRDHVSFQDFDAFFDDLYQRFALAESWKLYEDVLENLEILREKGFRLAMISNWDSRLPALIEQLGIHRFFEKVTVSALCGYEKPHPAIFQIALEDTGLQPAKSFTSGTTLSSIIRLPETQDFTPFISIVTTDSAITTTALLLSPNFITDSSSKPLAKLAECKKGDMEMQRKYGDGS